MTKNLKYILIPAFAGMMFASCNTTPQGPTDAELDAQVEVKVKEATDKMRADCDAQIMQVAQMKKDSILIKMGKMKAPAVGSKAPKSNSPTTTQTTTTTTTVVKEEPVKETPKGLKGLSDQAKKDQGKTGGLKGLSDQNKAKEKEATGTQGGLKSLSDPKK